MSFHPVEPFTLPLSPEEFRRSLAVGHGRVWLHLRHHGATGVEAILVDAFLRPPENDRQSEGSRAPWITAMLVQTSTLAAVAPHALRAVREAIARGDDDLGDATTLVLAIGVHLGEKPADVRGALVRASRKERATHRAWREELADSPASPPRPREATPEVVRAALADANDASSNLSLRTLGRRMTSEAAAWAWAGLGESQDAGSTRALLTLFVARDDLPPPLTESHLRHLESDDELVRDRAVRAFARTADSRLGAIARRWIASGVRIAHAMRLLAHQEAGIAYDDLRPHLDPDISRRHTHDLVLALAHIHKQTDSLPHDLLIWAYEHAPCSVCRWIAAMALDQENATPEWVIAEIPFDAESDTRRLAGDVDAEIRDLLSALL